MSVKFLPDFGDLAEGLGFSGIAGIILLPIFLPVFGGVGRPIAKAVVKGGIGLYERNRQALAQLSEAWEDVIAEAKAEVGEARMKSAEPMDS